MDGSCLTHTNPKFFNSSSSRTTTIHRRFGQKQRRLVVVAGNGSGSSKFGCGLNAPLEPSTKAGELLCGALLDGGCDDGFKGVAKKELEGLAAARDAALARLQVATASGDLACLHRRIAELEMIECQKAVEDIIYILALHKFSEIGVHLIPSLFKCICYGRLEILPARIWELESIYTSEVLELVRDHLNGIIGSKANSDINHSWLTTDIRRGRLSELYASSLLFGYFLQSASLRCHLEQGLESVVADEIPVSGTTLLGISKDSRAFGCVRSPGSASLGQLSRKEESLRSYVKGFDPDRIQMCAKPKSKEAMDLILRHNCALFGHEEMGLAPYDDELILTSFASVKRFVLEAIAFGYFLWDIESWVNRVYTLHENREV